jgi:hypothetical protein
MLFFKQGVNNALWASDLLRLKVKDVVDGKGKVREKIYLRQQKTGKEVSPAINKKRQRG